MYPARAECTVGARCASGKVVRGMPPPVSGRNWSPESGGPKSAQSAAGRRSRLSKTGSNFGLNRSIPSGGFVVASSASNTPIISAVSAHRATIVRPSTAALGQYSRTSSSNSHGVRPAATASGSRCANVSPSSRTISSESASMKMLYWTRCVSSAAAALNLPQLRAVTLLPTYANLSKS